MIREVEILSKLNIDNLLQVVVRKNIPGMVELNRKQMRAGERADNQQIAPEYSVKYLFFKHSKNTYKALFGTPDLFLTGSFQKKMFAEIKGQSLYFDSNDEKTNDLGEKYTDKIFGLNDKNKVKARKINDVDLVKLIAKKI